MEKMKSKPTLEQLLYVDFTDEKKRNYLIHYVSEIKWFKNNELDPTLENIEMIYSKIKKKYRLQIAYIQHSSLYSWVLMIKTNDTHHWVNTTYGKTFYELMLKAMIIIDAYVNLGMMQQDPGDKNE